MTLQEKYKPYLLFGGACYYAKGGWNDLRGRFTSVEAAQAEAEKLLKAHPHTFEWAHIVLVDSAYYMTTRQAEAADRVVWRSEETPHGQED